MKHILLISFVLTLSLQTIAQWNIKAGLLTPIPVNVMSDYQVDISSAIIQADYNIKNKWHATAATGYFRFRPQECNQKRFSNIPILAGVKYKFSDFHAGVMAGPALFNESEPKENYWKWLYMPYVGWSKNKWSIDLLYFNWEEVPNETNNIAVCVAYQIFGQSK